jgi:hypothetical protein
MYHSRVQSEVVRIVSQDCGLELRRTFGGLSWSTSGDANFQRVSAHHGCRAPGSSYISGSDGTVPAMKFLAMRPMTVTYQSDGNVHPSSSR